jgi:hypothetical protein
MPLFASLVKRNAVIYPMLAAAKEDCYERPLEYRFAPRLASGRGRYSSTEKPFSACAGGVRLVEEIR